MLGQAERSLRKSDRAEARLASGVHRGGVTAKIEGKLKRNAVKTKRVSFN